MMNDEQMVLRLIVESDITTRVAWMNCKEVYSSMGFTPPISVENSMEWYYRIRSNNSRCDLTVTNKDGRIMAFAGLTDINNKTRKAEFYIFVNPAMQGHGIGFKATYAVCQYGFMILGLHKIFLLTNESNFRARRLYEKIGFRIEGVHRDERISNDEFEDRLYYGLLRKEFEDCKYPLLLGFELHEENIDFQHIKEVNLRSKIGGG